MVLSSQLKASLRGLVHRNRGRRWSPLLLVLALVGSLLPVVPLPRAQAQEPDLGFLDLPGLVGSSYSYASTPDDDSLDITGDLEAVFAVALDDWSGNVAQTVFAKWQADSASGLAYAFRLIPVGWSSQLAVNFVWWDTGTSQMRELYGSVPGGTDGEHLWFRVAFDVDTGSGLSLLVQTSDDPLDTDPSEVSWTTLNNLTNGTVAAVSSNGQPLWLGLRSTNNNPLEGRLFYFELRDGIGGDVVANPDWRFDCQQDSATQLTDDQGLVWTVNGSASWEEPAECPGTGEPSLPTVTLDGPVEGDIVFHTETITASANSTFGVDRVEFLIGETVIDTVTSPPFETEWDTTAVSDGEHTVTVRAFDTAENHADDSAVVTVANDMEGFQRVEVDFEAGVLTVDEYLEFGVYSLFEQRLLPERYVGPPDTNEHGADLAFLDFLAEWDNVSQATRDGLTQFVADLESGFYATEEPGGGFSSSFTASSGEPDCTPNSGYADLATHWCVWTTPDDLFTFQWTDLGFANGIDPQSSDQSGVPDLIRTAEESLRVALAKYTDSSVYEHAGVTDPLGYLPPSAFPVEVQMWGMNGFAPPPGVWPGDVDIYLPFSTQGFYLPRHELFHVIQWEYWTLSDRMLPGGVLWSEATAEWAADESYPGDDNQPIDYASGLPDFLGTPSLRLAEPRSTISFPKPRDYGAFILVKYLSEAPFDVDFVKGVWERIGEPDAVGAFAAIDELLGTDHSTNLAAVLPDFWLESYELAENTGGTRGWVDEDLEDWIGILAEDARTTLSTPVDPAGRARPARNVIALDPGAAEGGSTVVRPGGASFVEFVHADGLVGELTVTVDNKVGVVPVPSDAHAKIHLVSYSSYPERCAEPAEISLSGGTGSRTLLLPQECEFTTLIVTHVDALSSNTAYQEWEAVYTPRGAIIDNGVIQLGVNPEGHLNVPGGSPSSGVGTTTVGLRYMPTNAEVLAPACLCEGWGVADAITEAVGWANAEFPHLGSPFNLELVSFTTDGESAASIVDAGGMLRVIHDYRPSPETSNLYEIEVTITNLSLNTVDVLYRRTLDWDIEPTPFNEFVTIALMPPFGMPPEVLFTSDDGFAIPNPLAEPTEISESGLFVDSGPEDHGALFDFGFGTLDTFESLTFTLFYGAAATESEALQAIGAVGAHIYSLGQPNTEDGPTLGTPNTFIFAFKPGEESLQSQATTTKTTSFGGVQKQTINRNQEAMGSVQ